MMKKVCRKCNREMHQDKLSGTTSMGGIVPKEKQVFGKVKYGICKDCAVNENRQQDMPTTYEKFGAWIEWRQSSKGA